jgi:signal transduction histidine kinase
VPSHIDVAQEPNRLITWTRDSILTTLTRESVSGVSWEADSASVLHLLVRAFEAMADGVVIYGDDGRIAYMNAATCCILEFDGAVDGVPVAAAIDGAWRLDACDGQRRLFYLAERTLQQLLHSKVPTGSHARDLRITTLAGRDVLLSGYIRPIHDVEGQLFGNIAVIREVTEQEQLERATGSRARQLRAALEAIPDAVIVFDGDERIVQLNSSARTLLELEEGPGSSPLPACASLPLTVLHEASDPALTEAPAPARRILRGEVLAGDAAPDALLHTSRRGDVPLTITGAPMRDAEGRSIGGMMMLRDATEGRQQEQHAYEVATQQDNTCRSDEFFALAVHELRNVTASLCGYVEMLSMYAVPGKQSKLTKGQIETIEEVEHAAGCLAELTDHIADVIRLQAGRFEMHGYGADLVALARRVAKRLQVTTQRHDIAVSTTAASIIAQMDVRRIEQVLTNLIGNAIKYSPDGGEIMVKVYENHGSGRAVVAVRDHGIGIPVDQHGQIFQRFGRGENARELDVEGTGLGLYFCREIVERHGGRIWFRSGAGGGTTFYISLPVVVGTHEIQARR